MLFRIITITFCFFSFSAQAILMEEDEEYDAYGHPLNSYEQNKETFHDAEGFTYTRRGNITYRNDGTTYYQSGNAISSSDGNYYEKSGNTIYHNGEEACRRTGNFLICN